MIKKNEEYEVKIIDNGFEGEGIAKIDGIIVFIPNALKGEVVKIKILKVTKNVCFGKVIELGEKSKNRCDVDCKTYDKCGGCNFRHIEYNHSLELKKQSVETTLRKALKQDVKVNTVIGMENPIYYRNKLQYPVGVLDNGEPVMGVFAERSHRIIETRDCKIQNLKCQKVAEDVYEFLKSYKISGYNEENGTGLVRHIIVRIGVKTDEIMLTLVLNNMSFPYEKEFIDYIITNNPEVKTIVKNLNDKKTNVILGNKLQVIYGDGYIFDYLGNKKFKISPLSFYQVNPIQTEKLYSKAVEFAELSGKEIVFDLYCGIGTIGIFASDKVKFLYGIETIPQAIQDAKQNAKLNNIENAEFFVGDVEKTLPEFLEKREVNPDVVFLDPPRKGCEKTALQTLLKIKPERIVYVSCNPATLARDLFFLQEEYEIKEIAICDMFPRNSVILKVLQNFVLKSDCKS
jgi:23S rRNA (uracil1939-C5)-methyltransferase